MQTLCPFHFLFNSFCARTCVSVYLFTCTILNAEICTQPFLLLLLRFSSISSYFFWRTSAAAALLHKKVFFRRIQWYFYHFYRSRKPGIGTYFLNWAAGHFVYALRICGRSHESWITHNQKQDKKRKNLF